jgi:hypothetical protein
MGNCIAANQGAGLAGNHGFPQGFDVAAIHPEFQSTACPGQAWGIFQKAISIQVVLRRTGWTGRGQDPRDH